MLDLTLMQEDFYYEQCVVMMRKSSPYTQKVSQLIGRLHESGLMLAWETQVTQHLTKCRLDCQQNWIGRTSVSKETHVAVIIYGLIYLIDFLIKILNVNVIITCITCTTALMSFIPVYILNLCVLDNAQKPVCLRTRRNFVFQVALKYLNYEVQLEVRLSRFHKDVDNIEPLNFRHVVVIFHLFIYYNRQQVMLTKNLFVKN